jgi:hypothetical protein
MKQVTILFLVSLAFTTTHGESPAGISEEEIERLMVTAEEASAKALEGKAEEEKRETVVKKAKEVFQSQFEFHCMLRSIYLEQTVGEAVRQDMVDYLSLFATTPNLRIEALLMGSDIRGSNPLISESGKTE